MQANPRVRQRASARAVVIAVPFLIGIGISARPALAAPVDNDPTPTCKESGANVNDLAYCGGRLLTNAGPGANLDVIPLLWGSTPAVDSEADGYFKALFDSNYLAPFAAQTEYSEKNVPLGGTTAGTYARPSAPFTNIPGKDQPTPFFGTSLLTDAQIADAIETEVASSPLLRSPSALYAVFTPSNTTVTLPNGKSNLVSCDGFYAYHSITSNGLVYMVVPDCQDNDGLWDQAVSHELIEAITDAAPGTGWGGAGGEIADLCENLTPLPFTDPTNLTAGIPLGPGVTEDYSASMFWENSMANTETTYSAGSVGTALTGYGATPVVDTGCTFNNYRWLRTDTEDGTFNSNQTYLPAYFNGPDVSYGTPRSIAKVYADPNNNVGIDMFSAANAPDLQVHFQSTWGTPGTQGPFAADDQFLAGDFDGDGYTDIVEARNNGGCIALDLHRNTHDNQFQYIPQSGTGNCFGHGIWSDSWYWVAGDFNGDGKSDVAVIWAFGSTVTIDLHLGTGNLSPGAGFTDVASAATYQGTSATNGAPPSGMSWFAGDVDGDGTTDLISVYDDTTIGRNEIDVHYNSGTCTKTSCTGNTAFYYSARVGDYYLPGGQGTFHPGAQWVAADFDNNGTVDLAEAFSDSVTPNWIDIDVFLSTCTATGPGKCPFQPNPEGPDGPNFATTNGKFYMQRWATRQQGWWASQKWFAADLNGDGYPDLGLTFADVNGRTDFDAHLWQ